MSRISREAEKQVDSNDSHTRLTTRYREHEEAEESL